MSAEYKRNITDIANLKRAGFEVNMPDDSVSYFSVKFHGPQNTYYEGGVWRVNVNLPSNYPDRPPIVDFSDKIYHPNICYATGRVCLDVLSDSWKAEYDLKLVFGTFLPQLLEELNADDPLNVEAANLMKYYSSAYEQRVRDETEEHAKPAAVNAAAEEGAENID